MVLAFFVASTVTYEIIASKKKHADQIDRQT